MISWTTGGFLTCTSAQSWKPWSQGGSGVCWLQNLPVTHSKTTTMHRLCREGGQKKTIAGAEPLPEAGWWVGSSPGTTRTELVTAPRRIHSSEWLLGGIGISIKIGQKFVIFECERCREAVLQKTSSQAAWMLCNGYRKFLTGQSRFVYIWNIRSWNKIQKMISTLMKCSWHPLILNFIFVLYLLLHRTP